MLLVLMCGLSFAGKTTFAGHLAEALDARVVSLDAINAERDLVGGRGIGLDEWAKTNDIAHRRAAALLRNGSPVVVDDTGSLRFLRDRWRDTAAKHQAAFGIVWMHIDQTRQQQRIAATRATRDREDVIDDVLSEHVAGFQPPVDEAPIVVDADDANSAGRARQVAAQLQPE